MRSAPPIFSAAAEYALFLDIDGTLAEVAATPEMAIVQPETRRLLLKLFEQLQGAVAVVSGRQLTDIDRLIGLSFLPAAGIHGAQLRRGPTVLNVDAAASDLDSVKEKVGAIFCGISGVRIEHKPHSVAIHYRASPSLGPMVIATAERLVRNIPGLKMITGKMIAEILPASADKGKVVRLLMSEVPFLGRKPVFAGDDTTDEDAFLVINELEGISIKIGAGPSHANTVSKTLRGC